MQHTNPVFQVLVTSTSTGTPATGQLVLAKGLRPSALKNGQIGFFNAHTGLSIDSTSTPNEIRDYYIMVGVNRSAGGVAVAEDIQGSSGYYIQPRNTTAVTLKGFGNEVSKVVEISGFSVLCETEYCIKLHLTNQQSYQINGFNTYTKTYCHMAACCGIVACGDCPPAGSSAEVAEGIAKQINADPDNLFTALTFYTRMVATFSASTGAGNLTLTVGSTVYTIPVGAADTNAVVASKVVDVVNNTIGTKYTAATTGTAGQVHFYAMVSTTTTQGTVTLTAAGGTGVTLSGVVGSTNLVYTDYTALPTGAGGSLRITANTTAAPSFTQSIPHKYFKAGTTFMASLAGAANACNGTMTTTQEPTYPSGKGIDLKALEYEAGGWNGKPGVYRKLMLTGLPKEDFEYFVSANGQYNVYVISSDIESVAGNMTTYKNPVATYIAVPCTDTGTLTGIAAILDVIYAGRFELTTDATALSCINPITSALPVAASGLEFVA